MHVHRLVHIVTFFSKFVIVKKTICSSGEETASSFSGLHDDVIGHSDSIIQSRESISHFLEK